MSIKTAGKKMTLRIVISILDENGEYDSDSEMDICETYNVFDKEKYTELKRKITEFLDKEFPEGDLQWWDLE